MVAHAAQIAGAGPGPQRFLPGVGAVVRGEERDAADAEGRARGQLRGHEALVDQLPAALEADAAFAFFRQRGG